MNDMSDMFGDFSNSPKLSFSNIGRATAKLAEKINSTISSEEITELAILWDEFFCGKAFIGINPVAKAMPALVRELSLREPVASLDEIPVIAKRGALAVPELCCRILLKSARAGGKGKEILLNAYKTFYAKEYKTLKKFNVLRGEDIFALTTSANNIEQFDLLMMSRIYVMSEFMDIPLAPDTIVFRKVINDGFTAQYSDGLGVVYKEKMYIDEHTVIPSDFLDFAESDTINSSYNDALEFISHALMYFDYSDLFIEDFFKYMQNREDTMDSQYYSYAFLADGIIKGFFKDHKFTEEEYGIFTAMLKLIHVFTYLTDSLYEDISVMSGVRDCEKLTNSKYTPLPFEKTPNVPDASAAKPVISPAMAEAVSDNKQELLEQITDLKMRLHASQTNEKSDHAEIARLKEELARYKGVNTALEQQMAELKALRQYVYNRENEENDVVSEVTPGEMKKKLAEKKVIIIGGNPNWTKKVRAMFPSWEFVSPAASGATSVSFAGADMIYFFTDTLSHVTYNAFISKCREEKLKFSYLHGVNIDKLIGIIYNDVCSK